MSQVNGHLKVTTAEEEFSSQVDRMTHAMDGQPLRPVISVVAQELINKVLMVAEMEVRYGLNNLDFYSLQLTWKQQLLGAKHDISRDLKLNL